MAHAGGRPTLGELLQEYRNKNNINKTMLSKLLGVGDDSLRSWEKGRFIPVGKNMINIINILGLSKQDVKYYFGTDLYGSP